MQGKHIYRLAWAAALPLLLLFSCKWFQTGTPAPEQPPLARVNDIYLYPTDVSDLLKTAQGRPDSAMLVSNYIDNWVKRQLLLQKAELYLPEDKSDVEEQVQRYREDLLIYTYEGELVKQKLDTTLTYNELEEFYTGHPQNFELAEDVVQLYYLMLRKDAPDIDSAMLWMRNDDETAHLKLLDYSFQYADAFNVNDTTWLSVSTVAKRLPLTNDGIAQLVGANPIDVADSSFQYLIKVNNYKRKGDIAPLPYIKDDVEKIVLKKKKLDFINNTYSNLYKDAKAEGRFEIY